MREGFGLDLTIVGVGCKKCDQLEALTRKALADLGIADTPIHRVQDTDAIAEMGVILTPVLVANGMMVTMGRVPTLGQLLKLLRAVLERTAPQAG